MSSITDNLNRIKKTLSSGTKLLAVSKTRPSSDIKLACEAGQQDFGENKVQDLLQKSFELQELDIRWHFIGHLQSNKINQLLKTHGLVSIHSIDSINLLNKLLTKNPATNIGIFLQVNTSGETEKSGFSAYEELEEAVELVKNSERFHLQGLMTIGKIRTENFEKDARECFSRLKELKIKLDKSQDLNLELSMGMSQDYEIAQEFGTNWVRIGTDIFGKRL